MGLGFLYSVTTVSRPPFGDSCYNNQGPGRKQSFAPVAEFCVVGASTLTAPIVYYHLGLFAAESQNILLMIIPSVLVGIPLGAYVIRRLDAEMFRLYLHEL